MFDNQLNRSYLYGFDDRKGWNYSTFLSFWNDFGTTNQHWNNAEFSLVLIMSVVSLIVNCMLVVIFSWRKNLHSNQNVYVIAIMCSSVIALPFVCVGGAARLSETGWPFGEVLCRFSFYSLISTAFVKTWLMAAISIDRYMKVVRSRYIPKKITIVITLLCCFLPSGSTAAMVFPNSIAQEIYFGNNTFMICTVAFDYHPHIRYSLLYFSTLFTLYFLIPSVVITVCYSKIMRAIKQSSKSLKHYNKRKLRSISQKQRTTNILILIVVLFMLMWTPLFAGLALATLDHVFQSYVMSPSIFIGILCVLIINTAVEPFLYSFTSSDVRNEVKMCFERKSNNVTPDSSIDKTIISTVS